MQSPEGEALQPKLERAQKALETAMDEACGVDLSRANTGELIRIDETLATASKAAKEAVSVRLRLRGSRQRTPQNKEPGRSTTPTSTSVVHPPDAHREFDDLTGRRWHAFAVRPSTQSVQRTSLPEAFRRGWLSFEAGDETRRVAPIPAKWEELPIDELRQLCDRAEASPKRSNPTEP